MASATLTDDPFRLDGRRVLVTGGSRGIGRAVVESLAAVGARVAFNYSTSESDAEAVVEAVRARDGVAASQRADLTQGDSIGPLFNWIGELWGGVDILINNAAITRDGYLMLMSENAWDDVMAVNLRAAFLCARQALRPMIRQRWGRIINVISPAALRGKSGAANYAAAKGGLLSMTKSLAAEVGRYNITVNAVCPGLIDTRMLAAMPAAERTELQHQIALGRLGETTEVANAIRFLASPAASYVSGTTLTVDGGLMMQ